MKKDFVLMAIGISIGFCSCNFMNRSSNEVQNDSVKISKAQRDSIVASRDLFAGLSTDMREDLLNILWEIDDIAGETFELERKHEKDGAVEQKVADQIKNRITYVKDMIEKAEEKAEDNVRLRSMLQQLKMSIEDQESEIERLRAKLVRKESKLQTKYDELKKIKDDLEDAEIVLLQQQNRLEGELEDLQNTKNTSWSKAGDKLIESLSLIKVTKKKKLGKKVLEAKMKIAEQAIRCYKKSQEMGDPLAEERIRHAESILSQLRNGEII